MNGVRDPVIDLRPRTYGTDWNNFGAERRRLLESVVQGRPAVAADRRRQDGSARRLLGELLRRGAEHVHQLLGRQSRSDAAPQPLARPGRLRAGGLTLSSATAGAHHVPDRASRRRSVRPTTRSARHTRSSPPPKTRCATPYVRSWNIGIQREIAAQHGRRSALRRQSLDARGTATTSTRSTSSRTASCRSSRTRSRTWRSIARRASRASRTAACPDRWRCRCSTRRSARAAARRRCRRASAYANTALITQLGQGQAGARGRRRSPARATYLCRMVGSDLEPCSRQGYNAPGVYPINVFQANPFASGPGANLNLMSDDGSFGNYHGLQLEFRRRYSKGFTINANYTFAKALGDMCADSTNATRHYIDAARQVDRSRAVAVRHPSCVPGELDVGAAVWRRSAVRDRQRHRRSRDRRLVGLRHHAWQSGRPFKLTSGRNTFNQRDSGVVLNGITRDDLQKMIEFPRHGQRPDVLRRARADRQRRPRQSAVSSSRRRRRVNLEASSICRARRRC